MARHMSVSSKKSKAKTAAATAAARRSELLSNQSRVPQPKISKPTAKSGTPPKRAMYQLRSKLIKRLDGQDQDELEQQQARLLRRASIALAGEGFELPIILDAAAETLPDRTPPAHNTRESRRGRPAKRYIDADEFLGPEENDELGLSGRHIPQIGLRRRVGRKPAKVPFSIWMAYKQLDDFVYRQSLSEEEVVALPTDDDAFDFQGGGGEAPSLPGGFAWDANKRLLDQRHCEQIGGR